MSTTPAPALRADCANCFALCCVALPFAKSTDFAVDKAAGTPCKNLRQDFRCGIHTGLRDKGFQGCTVFDCFGAGQQVSQVTFGGRDWRTDPGTARQMFEVFPVMRQLHELLYYLTEALALPAAAPSTRTCARRSPRPPKPPAPTRTPWPPSTSAPCARTSTPSSCGRANWSGPPPPAARRRTTAAPTSWAPASAARTCAEPTCAAPT